MGSWVLINEMWYYINFRLLDNDGAIWIVATTSPLPYCADPPKQHRSPMSAYRNLPRQGLLIELERALFVTARSK